MLTFGIKTCRNNVTKCCREGKTYSTVMKLNLVVLETTESHSNFSNEGTNANICTYI